MIAQIETAQGSQRAVRETRAPRNTGTEKMGTEKNGHREKQPQRKQQSSSMASAHRTGLRDYRVAVLTDDCYDCEDDHDDDHADGQHDAETSMIDVVAEDA